VINEIYTGKAKDKFDCPQYTQLVNKKQFVHSVIYHDQPLNCSITGNDNEKLPNKEETKNHDEPNDQKRLNYQYA